MIELTLNQLLSGTIWCAFLAAGLSVYVDHRRDRRRARSIQRGTIRCRVCGRAYPAGEGTGVKDCPDCGRGNSAGRDRRLG